MNEKLPSTNYSDDIERIVLGSESESECGTSK